MKSNPEMSMIISEPGKKQIGPQSNVQLMAQDILSSLQILGNRYCCGPVVGAENISGSPLSISGPPLLLDLEPYSALCRYENR